MGERQMEEITASESSDNRVQRLAILNLVFAVAQAFAPFLSAITGTGTPIGEQPEFDTPVTPDDYAFIIWSFILPAIIAYGVYQMLPAQRENNLLRRLRPYTLFAFVACTLWSIAAQYLWLWLTVVLMFGILGGLIGALVQLIKSDDKFSIAERGFVVVPISVYAGWITVAAIANTASWLKAAGFSNFILADETWAIIMLVAAGAIAAFVTINSRGNIAYALTIVWALTGVAAANLTEKPNGFSIAAVAAAMIALVSVMSRISLINKGEKAKI